MSNLETDLLLLENQIPYFVIHKLYEIQRGETNKSCSGSGSNCPLLTELFETPICSGLTRNAKPEVSCNNIHHYLHLVYMCMIPSNEKEKQNNPFNGLQSVYSDEQPVDATPNVMPHTTTTPNDKPRSTNSACPDTTLTVNDKPCPKNPVVIPCASRLHEAGVTFKIKKNPRDRYDISFKDGTLEVPLLTISYYRKVMWANIAAFEQTPLKHAHGEKTFLSYLALMEALVNTQEDVALLGQSGILSNMLTSEEDAADFFNDLGKLFVAEKYTGHDLFEEIRKYSDSTWHRNRARLMHNYFSNPWSSISVVAAGILLVLSVLQTYYAATQPAQPTPP